MAQNGGIEQRVPILGLEALPAPQRSWQETLPSGEVIQIDDYGPMRDIFGAGRDPEIRHQVWSGYVSFEARCEADPTLRERMIEATGRINEYYVDADPLAATRCVDSRRSAASRQPDFFEQPRRLGAQTTGATPVLAKVDRLVRMRDEPVITGTHSEDLQRVVGVLRRNNLTSGGHLDENHKMLSGVREFLANATRTLESGRPLTSEARSQMQKAVEMTFDIGCTAVDKLIPIASKKIDVVAATEMHGLTRLLMGDAYDPRVVDELVGRELRLLSQGDRYFEKDPATGLLLFKQQALEQLLSLADEGDAPLEELTGTMTAAGLVYNTVNPTTFDRDRFSSDNNDDIQLFNHDIWRSTGVVAPVFYPFVPRMSPQLRAKVERQHLEFETLRAMYTIGTMMTATDGSGHLFVRRRVE